MLWFFICFDQLQMGVINGGLVMVVGGEEGGSVMVVGGGGWRRESLEASPFNH